MANNHGQYWSASSHWAGPMDWWSIIKDKNGQQSPWGPTSTNEVAEDMPGIEFEGRYHRKPVWLVAYIDSSVGAWLSMLFHQVARHATARFLVTGPGCGITGGTRGPWPIAGFLFESQPLLGVQRTKTVAECPLTRGTFPRIIEISRSFAIIKHH